MTCTYSTPSWAAETLGEHINTAATLIKINAPSARQCVRDLGQRMLDAGLEAISSNSHIALLRRHDEGPEAQIIQQEDAGPLFVSQLESELEGALSSIIDSVPELWE